MIALVVVPAPAPETDQEAPAPASPRAQGALARLWNEWSDGMRFIRDQQTLRVLFLAWALASVGEGIFPVLYPIFVNDVLHGGTREIGRLMSAMAIGGLIGSVLLARAGAAGRSTRVIGLAALVFGGLFIAVCQLPRVSTSFGLQFGLFVLLGIPAMVMTTGVITFMQLLATDAVRGRVSGAVFNTASLLGVFGALIATALPGPLAARGVTHAVATVFSLNGVAYLAAGAVILMLLPSTVPKKEGGML
jgi:MFS family permease